MKRKNLILIIPTVLGFGLGPILGDYVYEGEEEIELISPVKKTVQQLDGNNKISYYTTNPIISNFFLSCTPGATYDFGPFYNCIVLRTDGNPGKLELEIPRDLLEREIGKVKNGFLKGIPFEIVSSDKDYTVIRIDVPQGEDRIDLVGSTSKPSTAFWDSLMFGGLIFLATLFLVVIIHERVSKRLAKPKI